MRIYGETIPTTRPEGGNDLGGMGGMGGMEKL